MAHVLLKAALVVLLASTLIAGNVRDQCSFSISHIVAPIADVPLFVAINNVRESPILITPPTLISSKTKSAGTTADTTHICTHLHGAFRGHCAGRLAGDIQKYNYKGITDVDESVHNSIPVSAIGHAHHPSFSFATAGNASIRRDSALHEVARIDLYRHKLTRKHECWQICAHLIGLVTTIVGIAKTELA